MPVVNCLVLSAAVFHRFNAWCNADAEAHYRRFVETAFQHDDGTFAVPLSRDVAHALERIRSPGQSDDELVLQLLDAPSTKVQ